MQAYSDVQASLAGAQRGGSHHQAQAGALTRWVASRVPLRTLADAQSSALQWTLACWPVAVQPCLQQPSSWPPRAAKHQSWAPRRRYELACCCQRHSIAGRGCGPAVPHAVMVACVSKEHARLQRHACTVLLALRPRLELITRAALRRLSLPQKGAKGAAQRGTQPFRSGTKAVRNVAAAASGGTRPSKRPGTRPSGKPSGGLFGTKKIGGVHRVAGSAGAGVQQRLQGGLGRL